MLGWALAGAAFDLGAMAWAQAPAGPEVPAGVEAPAGVEVPARSVAAGAVPTEAARLAAATERLRVGGPDARAEGLSVLAELARAGSPRVAGQAAYRLGVHAEEANEPEAAAAHYARALQRDPGGRFAGRAQRRLATLGAVPTADRAVVTAFEDLQRNYLKRDRGAVRSAVAALVKRAQTTEVRARLVRWQAVEALRDGDRRAAFALALDAAQAPDVAPRALRLAFELALSAAEPDQLATLAAAIEATHQARPEVGRRADLAGLLHEIGDLRKRRLAGGCFVACGAVLLIFAVRARAWRALRWATVRRWRPWRGLAYLGWTFGAAAVLAARFEPGLGLVVGACGAAVAPVQLVAGAIGQTAPPRGRAARLALALALAGATLGACYLVLARTGRHALMGL